MENDRNKHSKIISMPIIRSTVIGVDLIMTSQSQPQKRGFFLKPVNLHWAANGSCLVARFPMILSVEFDEILMNFFCLVARFFPLYPLLHLKSIYIVDFIISFIHSSQYFWFVAVLLAIAFETKIANLPLCLSIFGSADFKTINLKWLHFSLHPTLKPIL